MITTFQSIKSWLGHLAVRTDPGFVTLDYVDLIINHQPIFMISWEISGAYTLQIPEVKFRSYAKKGSAYFRMPGTIEQLTIKVSNCWKSRMETVRLYRMHMEISDDFRMKLTANLFNRLNILLSGASVAPMPLAVKIPAFAMKANAAHIKNLDYQP